MDETITEITESIQKYIYGVGGTAALILAVIFFTAIIELMTGSFELFQNNFIIRLIKLHAEFNEGLDESLQVINLLDIIIIALIGTIALTLYPTLRRVNKTLAIITIIQPFLGMMLFIITQQVGRTTVFSTVLTISAIMLWTDIFNKSTAYLGILATVLLLVADISFLLLYSELMAIIMSIGYLLFIPWCFLISIRLYQLVYLNNRMFHQQK